MRRRARLAEAAVNAALLAGSTLIALLAAEAAARVLFAKELDERLLKAQVDATSLAPFTRPSAVPDLIYELRPGADVVSSTGVRVKVDALGCRVAPGRPPAPAGALRVALIGDSSPFGWGVNFEDSYGEVLRGLLEARWGRPVEVRNFSVPGYNGLQNRLTLESKALPWKPDLVILHYDHNDSDAIIDKPPDYMDPAYGDNALHSALVKLVRRRLRRLRNLRGTTTAEPGADKFFLSYRYAGPQFERHMLEMKRLAASARAAGVPAAAFIFNPWLRRFDDPDKDPFWVLLHKPVSQRLAGFGLNVIDCYPRFEEFMRRTGARDLGALWLSRDPLDGHPNPRGHRLIAGLLADALGARAPRGGANSNSYIISSPRRDHAQTR